MAGTRKSRRADPPAAAPAAAVARYLQQLVKAGDRVVVALSGGIDSMVLLDVVSRLAQRRGFRLAAIHVNHQLSPHAAAWAAFCRGQCRSRGIRLRTVKVDVPRGDSVEAAARQARYREFGRLRADFVVLAHNQDDQVETLLLQLLRGAGVRGAAAMPVLRGEDRKKKKEQVSGKSAAGPAILRPLLDVPRSAIERHARRRGLEWIEDESNADSRYARNFLRREVLPLMASRFPAYRTTLTRAARHFAESARLLDALACLDAGQGGQAEALPVATLRGLTRERACNLLRWYLARRGVMAPNTDRLTEALRQALGSRIDARLCIDLGDHELRRHAGALHVVAKCAVPAADFALAWRGEQTLALPAPGGVLRMVRGRGNGISLARLAAGPVVVRFRRGGERLQPDGARPRRSLKNLLQEARMPPWQRARLPLIYCGRQLAWVAGIGTDAAFRAGADEPSVVPVWQSP